MEFRVFSPSRSAFQDAATGLSLACGAMASLLFTFVFFKLARKGIRMPWARRSSWVKLPTVGWGSTWKGCHFIPSYLIEIPERCMPKMEDSPRKCLWKSNGREKRIGGLQNVAGSYTRAFGWKYMKIFGNETQKRGVVCWMIFRFATKNPFRKFFSSRWWFQRCLCSARKLGKMNPILTISMFHIAKRSSDRWFFERFLGYEARNMEKRAQTTLLKQKLGEIKEPLKDTSEENLAKVDPEKELNHLLTISFKGMC